MLTGSTQEGKANFAVATIHTPCQTYYKIFGHLRGGPPPLVVLHGGPGAGHEYCLPFGELWQLYGIPVVFYDQIGCAASTHLPHTEGDESFWTVDLFVAELENLLSHLGIDEANGPGFDVLGHSWGGIVATKFASRQPNGLRRLILIGAPASGQSFFNGLLQLTRQLSMAAQQAINHAVKACEFTTPAYLAAVDEFRRTFLCRADPWPPEELALNFKHQAEDGTVRRTMQGPSPWVYNGALSRINSIPLLPHINVPTLVINGEFDTTQELPTIPFFNHIPRVRWVTITNASHMSHLDSMELKEKTLKLIGSFLQLEQSAEAT